MIVWRLEDKDGSGPFYTSKREWPEEPSYIRPLHARYGCTVEAYNTAKIKVKEKLRFGCSTREDLNRYFGGILDKFEEKGWKVQAYKVPKRYVHHGYLGFELAFRVDKAVRVDEP